MAKPLAARSLAFRYGEKEDRLFLAAGREDETRSLVLTRRMTSRLVNGLARLLERSSAVVGKAPVEMQDDIILLEHQKAIQAVMKSERARGPEKEPDGASGHASSAPLAVDLRAHLVTGASITTRPQDFVIVFNGQAGALIQLQVTRSELHRVLEVLSRRAEAVGWNLKIDAAWLDPDQTVVIYN